MTEKSQNNSTQTIKDLAEAASNQIKIGNRIWIGLIILSIFIILPRPNIQGMKTVSLPFDFPDVEFIYFYFVSILLLSVFIIAFCQAHAQSIRALKLAHRAIDKMMDRTLANETIYPRDFFDMLIIHSFSRVAPLPQLLRGKYQFFPESSECPRYLRRLITLYYVILQILSIIVYYCVPGIAFTIALMRYFDNIESESLFSWNKIFIILLAFITFVVLLQIIVYAIKHVINVAKIISKSPKSLDQVPCEPDK